MKTDTMMKMFTWHIQQIQLMSLTYFGNIC